MKQNRERELLKRLFLTPDEWDLISEKMQSCGTTNFSAYARKMLIDGYVVKTDFSYMKELISELGAIGRNINQIAKVANSTRNIREAEVKALQRDFFEMKAKISERLVKLIKKEY